jgi:two-component system, NtrC family, response regulator HydG
VKPRALVVDDDAAIRYTLGEILRDANLEVQLAENGEQALGLARSSEFDLVITDLRMTPMDGLELLGILHAEQPSLKVILVTAHGSERCAVEAMRLGAYDYFKKPFELDELMAVVGRALETVRLCADNERLVSEGCLARTMVFRSAKMSQLALLVARVAPRDVTVLITGESGTGKECVADALVQASRRSERPFLRFNCATLTSELCDAELFGHRRGAFTGAEQSRRGLFREADGGTLLLDEIGELDLALQSKLLRVLSHGEVRPLGEDRAVQVDVRILAATHRDLPRLVEQGRFREDLYYRLKVVRLEVPPLRERPEDVSILARHFLNRYAERFGTGPLRVPPGLFERLAGHTWPGNVRELSNAIESMVALCENGEIDLSALPSSESTPPEASLTLKQRVEAYERGVIVSALEACGGNRQKAAERLGLSRATMHDKLHRYGIVGRE